MVRRRRPRDAVATLRAVTESTRVLVVLSREDEVNWLSLRNVPEVHLLAADQLNTYDVLVSDDVVFTQDALEEFCDATVTLVEPEDAADESDESDADDSDADEDESDVDDDADESDEDDEEDDE